MHKEGLSKSNKPAWICHCCWLLAVVHSWSWWFERLLDNSRIRQLTDWTTRRLDISWTGQLADATGDFACLLWSPCVIGQTIIFSSCSFYLLPYFGTWCGLSANLECRSDTCCTRLAANTGRKKVAKNRHLGTIAQLRRAISSQLRHVSTIGKKSCLLYTSDAADE